MQFEKLKMICVHLRTEGGVLSHAPLRP